MAQVITQLEPRNKNPRSLTFHESSWLFFWWSLYSCFSGDPYFMFYEIPSKLGSISSGPSFIAQIEVFSFWNSSAPIAGHQCWGQSWIWHITYSASTQLYMGVSENSGTPKSSILIGFSNINHPFWGTSIFGNTHIHFNKMGPYQLLPVRWNNPRFPFLRLFLEGFSLHIELQGAHLEV